MAQRESRTQKLEKQVETLIAELAKARELIETLRSSPMQTGQVLSIKQFMARAGMRDRRTARKFLKEIGVSGDPTLVSVDFVNQLLKQEGADS